MSNPLTTALEQFDAEIVHVGQFDYASVFRERRLRRTQFLEWATDARFANVLAYWDSADNLFGGTSYYTETVEIDPASIRRNPTEPGAVTMIAELSGEAKELMPRQLLRRQIERASTMGFSVDAAFEFELIVLDESDTSVRDKGFEGLAKFAPDNKCWSGATANTHAGFIAGMEAEILGHDVNLYGLGVELGPGCLEATLGATEGLRAADDAAFFRMAARSYARKHGKTASFMPYLGAEYPGIGGHCTVSLRDKATGKNLFSDPEGKTSALAGSFIAGMMQIVPEAFAMCTSTVNAYRRLAPGSWAPKSLTWAEYPFTVAVRSAPHAGDRARLEFRVPPADCNPYLTLALMLGAGLDGIERKLATPAPTTAAHPDFVPEGAARFPRDLAEAADRLEASADAARIFGAAFTRNFAAACRAEYASLSKAVSAEERARYLEG
ncbi:glutamine synthetase [Sinirhodobacter sp. WL0062]|uniref:Glutamine synthetase n=1 Tax=Rhodobacter flavimaris TaxID=2907145 RepID=A0ABS8YVD0_9RHOB|nr:glutamine synthetase [Sinirhodobacter sp. WL0062]MCE5973050.1 glutamine synthetase [Sinirhodobacter sp. WL0062]